MGRGSFQAVKRLGREDHHSPPSSAEVKNEWSYTPRPLHAFVTWKETLPFVPFHTYTIKKGVGGPMKAPVKCERGHIYIQFKSTSFV